jgi:membrane fusion protein (multidrug efflux system)
LDVESAEVQITQLEHNNVKKLSEKKSIAEYEVQVLKAKLANAAAKAQLARAALNFTNVRAPFDGSIDRFLRQRGSFVLKGETVTHLVDNSILSVSFDVPESRYRECMAEAGQSKESQKIELVLSNQTKFPQTGQIGAIEAGFSAERGIINLRADFPNPDGLLRHGQA